MSLFIIIYFFYFNRTIRAEFVKYYYKKKKNTLNFVKFRNNWSTLKTALEMVKVYKFDALSICPITALNIMIGEKRIE